MLVYPILYSFRKISRKCTFSYNI